MTEFLVKRFVKDYQQTEAVQVRTAYGTLSSMVGIFCNVLLFGAKLLIGLLINSISVMADAFNNLSDAASSIIGFIGVKMAEKPADDDHPFGHGRIEYIAAFIVAFIVIQVGFSLFKTSLNKILNPESMSFKWISIVILSLSVAVKLWLSLFNRTLGKRINSKVMLATAADAMGDVVTTSATMLSIAVFGIFGVNIDGIVGIAVSVVVMIAGVNIAKDTLAPLIGEAIDPQLYEQISNFVESFEGILGTHDLIVHNYGPSKSMASIHAEVPNDVNVERSHEVIDQIEHEAARRFGLLLVIHMDPVETHDGRIREFRDMLGEVLTELDSRLSFHDFRMVDGVEHINLIFDLVVPREYKAAVQDNLKARISAAVRKRDPRCACVITVENSYLAEAQK
ncbi:MULTISPECIES: cation diffusion facilitator family transporter [Enterocloster]|uniref:cation diffusion facilitator family transporter n=1 Tax=Enterocloster TaxID=2719313 RepID=UPI000D1AF90F|nr:MULTISPECIES: cation diffusion facilitator family transporter [Enterocloster]MBS5607151.1 cation transporter [Enterocloster asparagiformis]MCB6346957.1 cation diffusion facilitator family transporter [Enterocloster lavalensis]MDR3758483.1 cation diffusion facilitator family transporter [Enterocloster sp.]PST29287.1 cation-efflux pump [Enterocloster lavalensis]